MNKFKLLSIWSFIVGILCWIPNLFFYSADNPPMFIYFTPLIGILGIVFALKSRRYRTLLITLNALIALSIPFVLLFGTLLFGP